MALKRLFGNDSAAEQLPAELRSILAEMRQERAAFEALTTRAQESAQQLGQLTQPIEDAQKTVGELQSRVKSLERLVPVLATLDEQTEAVAKSQLRAETQLGHVSEEAKRVREEIDELRARLEGALSLKNELAGFLEMGDEFKTLRTDADSLSGQLRDLVQGFDRVRERQDEVRRGANAAHSRLAAFEERQQQAQEGISATETRVTAAERNLAHLEEVGAEAAETKHELATLKSLADLVTQKVSALEQQREAVDRVTAQTTHLNDLVREIDLKIHQHEERAKSLGALESKVDELRAVHSDLLARSGQVVERHEEIQRADEELRGQLAALHEEVQRTVQRFEMENQGLDGVGQRIVDLRGALTDVEARFRSIEESSRSVADVGSRADGLASQLESLSETFAQLETHAERVNALRVSAERLGQTVEGVDQRVARLEKVQPTVEAVLRDFAELKGTHEAIQSALDGLRAADAEISQAREAQAGTKGWLANVAESVKALQSDVGELERMKPTVEEARTEADRVARSMEEIESRRELVEGVGQRLSDLTSLGEQLEERSRGLGARMDSADQRFTALAAHAEEAERVERLVPQIVAGVEGAERRATRVEAAVGSLEDRCQSLEAMAERIRALGQELDLRQGDLDRASEQLERASRLREDAASVAQQLEDRTGELTSALTSANARAAGLSDTLDELDSRAGNLRFVQKRMAQFEERLAKWQAVELDVARGLERVTQRQSTLDALEGDLQRLFDVAERTLEDVRAIAAARDEVGATRNLLESVLNMVGHAHDVAGGLEHRKRQVEHAEKRVARVEALLTDIQSSLETLHGQKAFLDQVVEKAGALSVLNKHAEAIIQSLREERSITGRVRAAVEQTRRENGDAAEETRYEETHPPEDEIAESA